jgi:hypothetical protein
MKPFVIPAKAGIQFCQHAFVNEKLDPSLRRDDRAFAGMTDTW